MRTFVYFLAGVFMLFSGLITLSSAQVTNVHIKINGMACPFCAYGLEKKLKKFDGVGKVTISLNKGMATLDNKDNQSIEFENLASAIKDAGFSAQQIDASIKGVLSKSDDGVLLKITNSDKSVVLVDNDKLQSLLSSWDGTEKSVSVRGLLSQKTTPGQNHPFSLTIQEIEVK